MPKHNTPNDSFRGRNLRQLFSVAEAARYLNISPEDVRSLERRGDVRAVVSFNVDAARRKIRFTAAALRAYARWGQQLDALLDRLCEDASGKKGDVPRRLLTVAETAEFLGLSPAEVRSRERSGFLSAAVPCARGVRRRRIYFTADSLREFIRMSRRLDDLADFFVSEP